jgi:hypothetical protein
MSVHSVYLQFSPERVRNLVQIYSQPDFELEVIPAEGGCVVAVVTKETRAWVPRRSQKRVEKRIDQLVTSLTSHLRPALQPNSVPEWSRA